MQPNFSRPALEEEELLATVIPIRAAHLPSLGHFAGACSTRIKPAIFSCIFSKHNIPISQGHSIESMSSVFSFFRFHSTIQLAWEDGKYLLKLERTFTAFIHLFCSIPSQDFLHIFWPKYPLN